MRVGLVRGEGSFGNTAFCHDDCWAASSGGDDTGVDKRTEVRAPLSSAIRDGGGDHTEIRFFVKSAGWLVS